MHKENLKKLENLFIYIYQIMEQEGEQQSIIGIRNLIAIAQEEANNEPLAIERIKEIKDEYLSMSSIPNGFQSFMIWKETVPERMEANKPLDKLKDEIWDILEKYN